MTGGRGAYSATFSHYEQMPPQLAQRVIDEYQAAREEARR
jgi:translation elongation factor EF-G